MCGVGDPTLSKGPREVLRVQNVAVAASSCHQLGPFRAVWPKGIMQRVPVPLDRSSGRSCSASSASSAHLCRTSCLCPAGALLHCLCSRLLCVQKIWCQQGLPCRREKDKSSSFSALFTCYSFLFQAFQQTAMKLLDIHKQKSGLLSTDIDQEGQSVC